VWEPSKVLGRESIHLQLEISFCPDSSENYDQMKISARSAKILDDNSTVQKLVLHPSQQMNSKSGPILLTQSIRKCLCEYVCKIVRCRNPKKLQVLLLSSLMRSLVTAVYLQRAAEMGSKVELPGGPFIRSNRQAFSHQLRATCKLMRP
jgi:hypothetical protein